MKRVGPTDKVLLGAGLPLFALCIGLSIHTWLQETGFPLVFVTPVRDATSYPVVNGFRPYAGGAVSDLRVGDRLLRVGESDLQGVGPVGFFVRAVEASRLGRPVLVVFERRGENQVTSLAVRSYAPFVLPLLPASLAFALVGTVLLFRARPSLVVRAGFQAMGCLAIALASYFAGSRAETYAAMGIHLISASLAGPLLLRAASLFPHGLSPSTPWSRAGFWLLSALGPLEAISTYGLLPPRLTYPAASGMLALGVGLFLAVTTRNYRCAHAIGRRQLRWIMFGFYCAFFPPMLGFTGAAFEPRLTPVAFASMGALAFGPIFVLIAVARYNLLDVDRLISAAASYNILVATLLAGVLVIIPLASRGASEVMGLDPLYGQTVLSVVLAVALIPAHRLLRPQIERLFFAERYAFDRSTEDLIRELSTCEEPGGLIRLLAERLSRLLRPETCVVYACSDSAYAPAFVEGRAVPPAFEGSSPLVGTLRARGAPLVAEQFASRRAALPLSPFDRAALETLQAAVVLPFLRGGELCAFLCLGVKCSGDVYTRTDVALLRALADKASSELLRFEQEQIIDQTRSMQNALARYVPGAVAKELLSGRSLDAGEREVSVLFIDIRGYTAYSEGRPPAEIFSTVNRYTETVSEIVRRHGGSVVEFNGDGMMAVFGAPRELDHKESSAVEAGREMLGAVEALPVMKAHGGRSTLSVGVGIATGQAFVGSIRAVDRLIWTAIGNTTNLASRLQSLTRDFDAAMVIDSTTWDALGSSRLSFVKHGRTTIRGRTEPMDVYVLPLGRVENDRNEQSGGASHAERGPAQRR